MNTNTTIIDAMTAAVNSGYFKNKPTVYASAPNIERITKLINEFYYSTSCRVEDEKVYNAKGLIGGVEVIKAKGKKERYLFQSIAS